MYTSLVKHPQDKALAVISIPITLRQPTSPCIASRDNSVTESN